MLTTLSIECVQSLVCNSFPKIFGNGVSIAYLNQIDIFNDYLALAGNTSGIPYLALASINTGGKYYWAITLS